MKERILFSQRLIFTGIVTIAIWILLIWDSLNGEVPSHHFLNRADLPEISNWWGGILLPLITWLLLYNVANRITKEKSGDIIISKFPERVIYGFLRSAIFGVLLSTFFTLDYSNISSLMMQCVLVLGLLFPIYRSEYLLGFIIGMTYTFGGVLPIIIGAILSLIAAGLYLFIRPSLIYLYSKLLIQFAKK